MHTLSISDEILNCNQYIYKSMTIPNKMICLLDTTSVSPNNKEGLQEILFGFLNPKSIIWVLLVLTKSFLQITIYWFQEFQDLLELCWCSIISNKHRCNPVETLMDISIININIALRTNPEDSRVHYNFIRLQPT